MFAQTFDHPFNDDIFSQYVNMDPTSADGNKDVSFPGDFDQIFALDSLSSDCGDLSPTISASKRTQKSPQPWGRDLWSVPQDVSSSSSGQAPLAFQDTIHPSAVADLNVNLEESAPNPPVKTRSPSTPPATPQRKAKSALVTPKSTGHRRDTNERRGLLRKQSFSPSLTRSSQAQKGRMAYSEAWAQRFQNFSLGSSDDRLPLSPPPSDILVQHEHMPADNTAQMPHPGDSSDMPNPFDSALFTQSPAISMPSPSANALARQQQRYLSQSNNSAMATSSPPSADDIFSSPHSSDPQSISSWHSDSLGTSALPFTPDLQSHDAQAWWSPMNSRVAQRQPSYPQMVASPTPQRPIQTPNNQHDMLQGGLMIQLDPSSFEMPGAPNPSFAAPQMPPVPSAPENQSYTHAPTTPQKFVDSSFAPHMHTSSSRSPSLSPTATGSPKGIRNANIRTPPRGRYQQRKMSSQQMSAPRPAKGSGGSPKGAGKSVTVSFVNFTPDDKKRILTGVAPSGSSKTKARREQEARDKRRRMNEAALNAVRKAGGDVEALEAVFG
ncbi:hypothetical protein P170DRAFT_380893 [Aspergillus steynii IBT 23096]|uniref:Developmental regulatory protein wetA n=1 Tax=Aspergillus steynii IBT 23096 TaxID=1392250 RepID=A0A2I2GBU7_9EURO|nr:uncharacterized protein P170DRAFT_380893 [Aspergillus steynii IBT 23096]PLB50317.1 hypothetical protein P170DRAFT_380893 [Aspergillus steynii IBT 23096]